MQERFLWGVATAAYQVEGGINGPAQPENNWAPWDRSGHVEPAGHALRFWDDPDALVDRAAALGCNTFRMSVEWARVQTAQDRWDGNALDRYAGIIKRIQSKGMEPLVTLHHFTHPMWCGYDLWLDHAAPGLLEAYVRTCVRELGRRLDRPVRWWITINEPAVVPYVTYVVGIFPGTGRGAAKAKRAYEHTIAAHIRAYDAIHDVYAEEGWAPPMVSTNTISLTLAGLDALLVDALLARERDVAHTGLGDYLDRAHRVARARVAGVPRLNLLASALDALVDRLVPRGLDPAGEAIRALYASPRARKLDYIAFDYYDPVVGNWARPGSAAARELRRRPGGTELWEQVFNPSGLAVFLRQAHLQAPDRPILVAENGMCTPGASRRPDGLRRDDYLRAMCAEVIRARDEGVGVAGYIHWTLADNYEWGSYLPRFGLYGVERADGPRILDTDAIGVDSAGAYREIVAQDAVVVPGGSSTGASAL